MIVRLFYLLNVKLPQKPNPKTDPLPINLIQKKKVR